MTNDELITVDGKINEILLDVRFGAAPDNEYRMIASANGCPAKGRASSGGV